MGLILLAMEINASLVATDRGLVLAAPFAIVGISRLARYFAAGAWRAGLLVLLLTAWTVISSLAGAWGGRPYLNEAVGGLGDFQAQSLYLPGDGGPDLLALKSWVEEHPEARSLEIAVRHVVGLKPFGLAAGRPPLNSVGKGANRPNDDRPVGPHPGYYAVDFGSLGSESYSYFRRFHPMARVGAAIVVYHITKEQAERRSARHGASLTRCAPPRPIAGRGFLRREYRAEHDNSSYYSVFVPYAYEGDRPYPLILFLHGAGDAGRQGDQYLKVGLPRVEGLKGHV